MASTPRSTIEDSYASGMRCAICTAETLQVGHVANLPDYVTCRTCGSAFLVEEDGERIFYGQIARDFPETEAFALRQWVFREAIDNRARRERSAPPEIAAEPEAAPPAPAPEAPAEPAAPEPDLTLDKEPAQEDTAERADIVDEAEGSAFASKFGFLEELAQSGPSSEPPGEALAGLIDSDEPHEADALAPPPWAAHEATPAAPEPAEPEPVTLGEGVPAAETAVEPEADATPFAAEPDPFTSTEEAPASEPDADAAPVAGEPEPFTFSEETPAADLAAGLEAEPAAEELEPFAFDDAAVPGIPVADLGLELEPVEPVSGDLPDVEPSAEAPPEPAAEMEADDFAAFAVKETEIPGEPVDLGPPDDPLGLASAFESLTMEYGAPSDLGIAAEDDPSTLETSRPTPAPTSLPAESEVEDDDWLSALAAAPLDEEEPTTIESKASRVPLETPAPAEDDSDWLAEMAETPLDEPEPEPESDWLASIEETASEAALAPPADWLAGIEEDSPEEGEPQAAEPSWPARDAEPQEEAPISDWHAAIGETTDEPDEGEVDWLSSLGDTSTAADEPMHTVTNWLSSMDRTSEKEEEGDSGIDWLESASEPSTDEDEEARFDAFSAGQKPTEEESSDAGYDPFDFNQRIASLKEEAHQEPFQEPEENDFLSGLRRSAAIPLESEPLDDTPLASVQLESKPVFGSEDAPAGEEEADEDPLAMAARMGALSEATEGDLPSWMDDVEEETEAKSKRGAFKLRETDPPPGQRHRVVIRGDRVVFPGGDCAHCGRTPVKGRLSVYGTLPNGQKVGQRKVTSFNVPLCGECRKRAALLTEEAGNARLQAHLISAIVGMLIVVLALVLGVIDPRALGLPDFMILAILLLVGYAGPVTFLLNRVGNYPPPPDAVYVRTTLLVPSETQGLETAFEWRSAEYAKRFFEANSAYTLGNMISVKDRLGTLEE